MSNLSPLTAEDGRSWVENSFKRRKMEKTRFDYIVNGVEAGLSLSNVQMKDTFTQLACDNSGRVECLCVKR
jgi:hypothetical protein